MSNPKVASEMDAGQEPQATLVPLGGRATLIPLLLPIDRCMACAAEIVDGVLADVQRVKSVIDG
jgi:hypothetical protein